MIGRLKQIISESGYSGLVKRLSVRMLRERNMLLFLVRDACFGSYTQQTQPFVLNKLFKAGGLDVWRDISSIPQEVIHHYLEHRFDLLGSGWVNIFYGMNCRGLEQYRFAPGPAMQPDSQGHWLKGRINKSNLLAAQKVWQQVDPNYIPIDWQIDFKSGYRWSEKAWSKKIKFGHRLGIDVKVPWELARMQHLPQLALSCFSSTLNEESKSRIKNEFQNQVLDFIATNPPGYGVNWICPMDVAIRAANCLLAWNLLRCAQLDCTTQFNVFFAQSIYDHGRYIVENLEWMPDRANHYLANISGLVFIAASLPSTKESDLWLAFAIQELIVEVERQFDEDGGNFEGSTSYHRLSAEMVYYATALVLGLAEERLEKLTRYNHRLFKKRHGKPGLKPAPLPFHPLEKTLKYNPFPRAYFQRMERMVEFIKDTTKPDGSIPQIGDNDSGRFFKLEPVYQVMTVKDAQARYANLEGYCELAHHKNYYMEDHLNCGHIVAKGHALFGRSDFADWLGVQRISEHKVDALIFRALAAHHQVSCDSVLNRASQYETIATESFHDCLLQIQNLTEEQAQKTEFRVKNGSLLEGLKFFVYPDFGLFLFKSPRLYLAIRCWIANQPVHSSHRHQDQLSVELSIDGKNLICDPGTYLYTPLPAQRRTYRGCGSHFSPFAHLNETASQTDHVFSALQLEKAHVVYCGLEGFVARATLLKQEYQLLISLENKAVVIYHETGKPRQNRRTIQPIFSSGYGVKDRIGISND